MQITPLCAIWMERHTAELAGEEEHPRRAAAQQEAQPEWREALDAYQRHLGDGMASAPRRPWWHSLLSLARWRERSV